MRKISKLLLVIVSVLAAFLALEMFVSQDVDRKLPVSSVEATELTPVKSSFVAATGRSELINNPNLAAQDFAERVEAIRVTYPIEPLRKKFDDVFRAAERKELRFAFVTGTPARPGIAMTAIADDGIPVISVFLRYYAELASYMYGDDDPMLDDLIVAIILHEAFHAFEQTILSSGSPDALSHVEAEREAWLYTIEYIVLPAKAHGRFQRVHPGDPLREALSAYEELNGDSNSVAFDQFSDWATKAD
jgi:hypothetical protein